MRLILNEQELLDKSLNEGHIDIKKPTNTIRILAKHYFSVGMSFSQVVGTIDIFFKGNFKKYNSVKWIDTIEKVVREAYKNKDHPITNIKQIEITENELNTITLLNDLKYEKLAFTLLVYAKIYNKLNNNDKNWVNEEHKYIFSDAKLAVNVKDQGKMIHKLNELGLTESAIIVDKTNVKVKFIDNNSPSVLIIKDFRNLSYHYLRWKGKNIIECENCGLLIFPTNNKTKYCPECSKEIKMEMDRLRMKEIRNSRK